MAGGATTLALAQAAAAAGAFPFLAGGYRTADALMTEVAALRSNVENFGVNLFVPATDPAPLTGFQEYAAAVQGGADALNVTLDRTPRSDDDDWDAKVARLLAAPVPVVSLTFELPTDDAIAALQQVGTRVLATVTSVAESQAAEAAGVDGLIVQGASAGGHSAVHDPYAELPYLETGDLVTAVRNVTALPLVAAGGVDGPAAVAELLAHGASAVAVGTLLLRTDEAGTSRTHRDALADPRFTQTVLTRAFTGRIARALANDFTDRFTDQAISAYPAVHHLTRPLRNAAAAAGDAERLHLWAGTGYRAARAEPAAAVFQRLAAGCPA